MEELKKLSSIGLIQTALELYARSSNINVSKGVHDASIDAKKELIKRLEDSETAVIDELKTWIKFLESDPTNVIHKSTLMDRVVALERESENEHYPKLVRVYYFKSSGKYLTEDSFLSRFRDHIDLYKEFEIMRALGKLPGLTKGEHKRLHCVLVPPDSHPPILFLGH